MPVIVPLVIAGVSAVAKAKIQSNAASNAQKAQQQGTDRALQVNQQAMQPYMDAGQRGLAQLQNPAFSQPYTQVFGGPGGSNGAQAFGGPMTQMPPGGPPQPQMGQPPPQMPQGPPPGSLGAMGGGQMPQMPQQGMMPPAQQMAQGGAAGGTARIMSPQGRIVMVPLERVPEALAQGGRRVG